MTGTEGKKNNPTETEILVFRVGEGYIYMFYQ